MTKEDYKRVFEEAVKKEFESIKNEFDSEEYARDVAYDSVIQTANTEEVVGYYITYYEDDALKQWINDMKGIELQGQDKEIQKVLYELYGMNKRKV